MVMSDIRIIPARAGFTLRENAREYEEEDHPRSRGVYLKSLADRDLKAGSSPLARGLPARLLQP